MTDLVLHPVTRAQLKSFITRPSHAVVLVGKDGLGKHSTAVLLAEQILGITPGSLEKYPYHLAISGVDGKITIDEVYSLKSFSELKVPLNKPVNRTVIIKNADRLSVSAQNSLLKLLEEPPKGMVLILTVDSASNLLPTILSRLTRIDLIVPAKKDVKEFLAAKGYAHADVEKAINLTGNRPGLALSVLDDPDHPLLSTVDTAKSFLLGNQFERLILVSKLATNKEKAFETIDIIQNIARLGLQAETGNKMNRWTSILKACEQAESSLLKQAQPKLVLTKLALQF